MRTIVLNATIRLCLVALLLGFSSVASHAFAQSVVGVSEILSSTSASEIDTYSATELSYDASLYYGAAVEGYLYDGATQIRSGYAQAQQLADGYLQAPVNVGNSYTVQSDHYLILSVAYSDGSGGYYYNNPSGFLDGGGDYPSGSSFAPGGGPAYVSTSFIYLGTTTVNISTAAPSITSVSPTSITTGASGTITVNGNNLVNLFTQQATPAISGSGVNLTPGSSPTSDRVFLNYSVDSSASAGTQSLTLTTPFGISNGANLTINYPPATVTGISPNAWTAGQSYPGVQITGTNFGSTPTVSLSDPTITASLPYSTSNGNGTSTTHIDLSVPATTPTETVTVTITPGSGGASFTQGPGGPALSGSNTAMVLGVLNGQQASCPAMLDAHSGFSSIASRGAGIAGNGTMTVSFSGVSFTGNLTAPYGQYSTPESIASHLAALITQRYYSSGFSAEAYGAYILYKSNATLGVANFTSSDSSFTANPSPLSCPPVSMTMRLVPVASQNELQNNTGNHLLHNVWRLVTLDGQRALPIDYTISEHTSTNRGNSPYDPVYPGWSTSSGSPNIFNDGIGCTGSGPLCDYKTFMQKFTISSPNNGSNLPVMILIPGQAPRFVLTIHDHGTAVPTMNDDKGPINPVFSPNQYNDPIPYPCFNQPCTIIPPQ